MNVWLVQGDSPSVHTTEKRAQSRAAWLTRHGVWCAVVELEVNPDWNHEDEDDGSQDEG